MKETEEKASPAVRTVKPAVRTRRTSPARKSSTVVLDADSPDRISAVSVKRRSSTTTARRTKRAEAVDEKSERAAVRRRKTAVAASARPRARRTSGLSTRGTASAQRRSFSCLRVLAAAGLIILATLFPVPDTQQPPKSREGMPQPSLAFLPALSDTLGSGDAAASGTGQSLPTPLHFKVQDYVNHFQGEGRRTLQTWINRSAPLLPVMKQILKENQVPVDLVYIAMIESGLNMHSVSRAEAAGPWQIVPVTAKHYGLRIDQWVDERRDPVKSTRAAAAHLRDLHAKFGSWTLALASYNAGADTVRRASRDARTTDYWSLQASGAIPKETRNYVPKYIAVAIIASNLPAFGFAEPAGGPLRYDEVTITRSISLQRIAKLSDSPVDAVRKLNPELRGYMTPPDGPYTLRLPAGTKQAFLSRL